MSGSPKESTLFAPSAGAGAKVAKSLVLCFSTDATKQFMQQISTLANGVFRPDFLMIGADFKILCQGDKKLQVWSTAGQVRFRNILGSYFRGADLLIVPTRVDVDDLEKVISSLSAQPSLGHVKSVLFVDCHIPMAGGELIPAVSDETLKKMLAEKPMPAGVETRMMSLSMNVGQTELVNYAVGLKEGAESSAEPMKP